MTSNTMAPLNFSLSTLELLHNLQQSSVCTHCVYYTYTCTHMLTHTQTHYTPAVAVSGAS